MKSLSGADANTAKAALFESGRNCLAAVQADRAAVLIDAEAYFAAFARAAEQAVESIVILGWDFDSRTPLAFDESAGGGPPLLGDFLNQLTRRRRGLRIYVLIWDYPMVFGTDRETRPLYGLGWKPRRRVHLRYDNTHPVGGSHHQKIIVVDDSIAFCGGLDLTSRRWDTCKHEPGDKRRMVDGTAYAPFHDVMAAVDGEAAQVLATIARERWRKATGYTIPPVRAGCDAWPGTLAPQLRHADTAISRTIPAASEGPEVREIEALYLDMIRAAKDYIYLENQYFTSDAIRAALAARLAEPQPPEIVVVTRRLSHGWLEAQTMQVLRTRIVKALREADGKHRFDVYYPDVPGLQEGTCIDVHSKVTIVDDRWLRVGSSNLSNRSMGFDTECDVTFDAAADAAKAAAVRAVRNLLLSEHLGVAPERLEAEVAAQGSIHAAIRRLQCEARTLVRLENEEEAPGPAIALAAMADPERPVSIDRLIDLFSPSPQVSRASSVWMKAAPVAAALVALFLAWRYTPLAEWITAERVMAWARAAADVPWSPVAVIAAYVPVAFTMFPRPLLTLFAVVAFGPVLGFAISMTGIAAAAAAAYYAGRAVPRDTVRRLAGKRLNRTSQALRRRGLLAAIAMSIVPVAPFVVVGMVAGAVRVTLWEYLLGTLLGMVPGTLLTTLFGDQIAAALEDPSQINYWYVAAAVAVFVVLIVIVRRWAKQLERSDRRGSWEHRSRFGGRKPLVQTA